LLRPDHLMPFFSLVSSGGQIEAEPLPAYEAPTTTQVVVTDREENIVSLTHSLGYGSGVVTPGLGFLFNNYMNVFNPYPGHPDSLRPGSRRTSSMAPTIVTDRADRPVAALGAPGATRITSAVLQSLVNHLDHGMTPVEAVSAPRVDCQGTVVEIENRVSRSAEATLVESGYEVHRRERNYDPYFARAQMVGLVSGAWKGASDPRRDGGAPVYALRGRSCG
jgi:gamma-glutamyltranspeptidase/glutathione hydrolase